MPRACPTGHSAVLPTHSLPRIPYLSSRGCFVWRMVGAVFLLSFGLFAPLPGLKKGEVVRVLYSTRYHIRKFYLRKIFIKKVLIEKRLTGYFRKPCFRKSYVFKKSLARDLSVLLVARFKFLREARRDARNRDARQGKPSKTFLRTDVMMMMMMMMMMMLLSHCCVSFPRNLARGHKQATKSVSVEEKKTIRAPQYQHARERYKRAVVYHPAPLTT